MGSFSYRMDGFWNGAYRRDDVTFTRKIQPQKNKAHTERGGPLSICANALNPFK